MYTQMLALKIQILVDYLIIIQEPSRKIQDKVNTWQKIQAQHPAPD